MSYFPENQFVPLQEARRNLKEELIQRQVKLFERFRSVSDSGMKIDHLGVSLLIRRNVFWPCDDSIPLLESLQINGGERVLDMCTGSGVIGVFCALRGAGAVVAVDWNPDAISNAKDNSIRNHVDKIFDARQSDVFSAIETGEKFDIITANLPMMNMRARDLVESSIWDTNLRANKLFLSNVGEFIKPKGRIYMTQADFAAVDEVKLLGKKYGWKFDQRKIRTTSAGDTFFAFELVRMN